MLFTTGEIISAGTGRLCCDIEHVYRIMNHLTGESLYTHQLPRAFRVCEGWVRQQHPWLNELDESKCSSGTWKEWLADAVAKYGVAHDLEPLPPGTWLPMSPIAELEGMVGKESVTVVTPDDR